MRVDPQAPFDSAFPPLLRKRMVVGTQGSLGGFMGVTQGNPIAIKRWLLAHEGYRFGA